MIRLFATELNATTTTFPLDTEDMHHLSRVLRLEPGEKIEIVFENSLVQAEFKSFTTNGLSFKTVSSAALPIPKKPHLILIQALPKQDKFTDILRSCTEIGVDHFVPIISERVLGSIGDHAKPAKFDRWKKVIWSASLQSKRITVPTLHPVCTFKTLSETILKADLKIVLWEEEAKTTLKTVLAKHKKPQSIAIVIGPEGGLSNSEITTLTALGFSKASLGETVLRVEHAGFYTSAQIQYEYL